jgi:antitoxin component YwqK of YwqJK toxin-antitoxin module
MKRAVIIFLVFNFFIGYAQKNDTTTAKNGYNIFYFDNGKKSSEGTMKNGKADGYWKNYYKTGILKNEGNRKDFLLDSIWKFYNDKGQLTKTFNYSKGKKNGYVVNYDSAGIVTSRENFVNDIKQDTSYNYYKTGLVKQSIPFKNGKADGISYVYSPDTLVTNIIHYKMGYVEKQEKINQTDENGNKQGIWKKFYKNGTLAKEERFKDGTVDGYTKEYDKKGNLQEIKKYAFGKEVTNAPELAKLDVFKAYFDDGGVRYEGGYINGMPMGTHYKFHQSRRCDTILVYIDSLEKNVKQFSCYNISVADSAFNFQDGYLIEKGPVDSLRRRQKEWIEYNITGEFRSKGTYVDDKRVGSWEFFYPNQKTEQKGKYDKKGRLQGPWIWYYNNGNVLMKENYQNDKLQDGYEEYTEDGKLITKGEYLDGEKEGPWFYQILNYKEYGVYHGGMPDSIWKAYYVKENKLRFEGGFLNGEPDGKHTYYYENGKPQASGKYVGGQKDGNWNYFDENNFLVLTITYRNGEETKWDGKDVPPLEDNLKVFQDAKTVNPNQPKEEIKKEKSKKDKAADEQTGEK